MAASTAVAVALSFVLFSTLVTMPGVDASTAPAAGEIKAVKATLTIVNFDFWGGWTTVTPTTTCDELCQGFKNALGVVLGVEADDVELISYGNPDDMPTAFPTPYTYSGGGYDFGRRMSIRDDDDAKKRSAHGVVVRHLGGDDRTEDCCCTSNCFDYVWIKLRLRKYTCNFIMFNYFSDLR